MSAPGASGPLDRLVSRRQAAAGGP